MRIAWMLLACLVVAATGNVMAIDPSDEDASYLPQEILDTLIAPDYGADEASARKCVAAQRSKARSDSALKEVTNTCRIKATPKKCRGLSPVPAEKVSRSAQAICADACRRSGFAGECALN